MKVAQRNFFLFTWSAFGFYCERGAGRAEVCLETVGG